MSTCLDEEGKCHWGGGAFQYKDIDEAGRVHKILWLHMKTEAAVPADKTIMQDTKINNNFRDVTAWIQGSMGKEYLRMLFPDVIVKNYIDGLAPEFRLTVISRFAQEVKEEEQDVKNAQVKVSTPLKEATKARKRMGAPSSPAQVRTPKSRKGGSSPAASSGGALSLLRAAQAGHSVQALGSYACCPVARLDERSLQQGKPPPHTTQHQTSCMSLNLCIPRCFAPQAFRISGRVASALPKLSVLGRAAWALFAFAE